eukprot:jgi/Bigna1/132845/aug1.19_g7553
MGWIELWTALPILESRKGLERYLICPILKRLPRFSEMMHSPTFDSKFQFGREYVSLLPEIFARAARMHEGVAGGKIRFPAILQAYREVLLERGLNPQEDRLHIKYLLELKLSAGNDWWEKLSRVSGFKQGVKDATPLGTPPNATLEVQSLKLMTTKELGKGEG